MISVVIPLYNKVEGVRQALESVLAQTFRDFEIVVVDDGSTDGSADIVQQYADVRLVRQANAGVSAARNRGIAEARGEFIALLDADDEWTPDYLATQMSLAERYPQCDVFATDYEMHGSDGHTLPTIIRSLPFDGEDGVLDNYFEVAAKSHPPISSISVMARKSAFEAVGGFPLGIRSGEDLLTWARLACRYRIAYSRKVCAVFNVEGYNPKEKPKRVPEENDVVGCELKVLQDNFHANGLRQYRAMWHKMRASVYMRLRMRRLSLSECARSLRCNPFNYKVWAFILLNMLPTRFQPF